MKKRCSSMLLAVMMLTLVAAPLRRAAAQDGNLSPMVVVMIAPLDEQFADVGYIADAMQLGGNKEFAFQSVKAALPRGLDASKPMGGYVVMDGPGLPKPVSFLGVTDVNQVLADLKKFIPTTENVGDGITKVTAVNGNSAFVKQQGGWAFIALEKSSLNNLPTDPAALDDGLAKQYNVAVQIKGRNAPQPVKDVIIAQMKQQFKNAVRRENRDAGPLLDVYTAPALNDLEMLVNDTETLTFGLAIDQTRKTAYLEGSIVAVEGSKLAKEFAPLSQIKTDFAGFAMPAAAATLNLTGRIAEDDAQRMTTMLTAIRDPVLQEIDKDENLTDEEKTAAKDVLGTGLDVLTKTIERRRMDGGAALLLGDGPGTVTFVAGGFVADGPALDKALRTIVEFGKQESKELRAVEFDAKEHGGVTFHLLTYDVPDEEGRKVFGESVEMAVGFGEESVYFAFGRDTVATLKKVIDGSNASMANTLPPFKLSVSLAQTFQFGAAVSGEGRARRIADELASHQGQDRLELTLTGMERGARVRFEMQEGALVFLGKSVQQFLSKRNGFPKFGPGR